MNIAEITDYWYNAMIFKSFTFIRNAFRNELLTCFWEMAVSKILSKKV